MGDISALALVMSFLWFFLGREGSATTAGVVGCLAVAGVLASIEHAPWLWGYVE